MVHEHVLLMTKHLLSEWIHVSCEVFETVIIKNRGHRDDGDINSFTREVKRQNVRRGGRVVQTGAELGSYEFCACLINLN